MIYPEQTSVLADNGRSEVRGPPGSGPVITQAQLQRYQDLCGRVREQKAMRLELMELLDRGASVEPGNLTAEVRQVSARRLDYPKLVALLGPDRAEELRSEVEPTVSRQLILSELNTDQDGVSSKREWVRETPRSWDEILGRVNDPNQEAK